MVMKPRSFEASKRAFVTTLDPNLFVTTNKPMTDASKRVGRPATGKGVQVNQRIPADVSEAIDAYAARRFMSRGDAIRQLLSAAISDDTNSGGDESDFG